MLVNLLHTILEDTIAPENIPGVRLRLYGKYVLDHPRDERFLILIVCYVFSVLFAAFYGSGRTSSVTLDNSENPFLMHARCISILRDGLLSNDRPMTDII